MNIDNLPNRLRLTSTLSTEFLRGSAIDVVGYTKHSMCNELARALEERLKISCTRITMPDPRYEFAAELWVFDRDQLHWFINEIQGRQYAG